MESSSRKDGVIYYSRSSERPGNCIHAKLHHLRPFECQEMCVSRVFRVQLSPWGLSAVQTPLRLLWLSQLPDEQLLSVLPAGLARSVSPVVRVQQSSARMYSLLTSFSGRSLCLTLSTTSKTGRWWRKSFAVRGPDSPSRRLKSGRLPCDAKTLRLSTELAAGSLWVTVAVAARLPHFTSAASPHSFGKDVIIWTRLVVM